MGRGSDEPVKGFGQRGSRGPVCRVTGRRPTGTVKGRHYRQRDGVCSRLAGGGLPSLVYQRQRQTSLKANTHGPRVGRTGLRFNKTNEGRNRLPHTRGGKAAILELKPLAMIIGKALRLGHAD